MKRLVTCTIAISLCILCAGAALASALNVTVYNDNRALVNEQRSLKLKKGLNEVRFTDVAASIDPTSCLLYTSPSPRDLSTSRMPSSA